MGKEHFDLFPELHRNLIFFSFGQISGNLTRVFVLLAGDLARLSVGAAFLLGRADLADFFQGAIARGALARRPPAWIRVIPAELFERVALGADVLVVLRIPVKICACPGPIGASGLVDHRDVRIDLAFHEPAEHGA